MSTDMELLIRWRAGDREAGTALFERYYDRVERFFVNKVPDASTEIRDLVQDTFTALVTKRDQVQDPGKFRSYLFSVAYNIFHSHLRTRYRHGWRVVDDKPLGTVHAISASPSGVLWRKREERLLLEGLRRLPLDDQTLLELYYWEDVSTGDIGAILDIPRGTVKSRLRAARLRLEEVMTTIAESREVLASTLSDLEGWARKCQDLRARQEEAAEDA